MTKQKNKTIDQVCKGLRILETYNPTATVSAKLSGSLRIGIWLQELEFKEITEEDRKRLVSLNWETNGAYVWEI